jgi:hypothetical protein
MLIEKDSKILDISTSFNKQNLPKEYNINSNFFNDWIVVDDIESKDGPSNYLLKEDKGLYSIVQNSGIYTTNSHNLASSIIMKANEFNNIYSNIIFSTSTSGIINIMFKYKDFNNYIALELKRNNNEGEIKLIKKYLGKVQIVKSFECSDILLFFKKCVGFETENANNLEIFNINKDILIMFNSNIIYRGKEEDISDFNPSFLAISITNQNNITFQKIMIKEMSIEDFLQYQGLIQKGHQVKHRTEIQAVQEKRSNIPDIHVTHKDIEEIKKTEKGTPSRLKYNPKTNKFEPVSESNPPPLMKKDFAITSKSLPQYKRMKPKPLKIRINNKPKSFIIPKTSKLDDLLSSPFPIKNIPVIENKPKYTQEEVKRLCLSFDKQEYVCNYISSIIIKNNIDLEKSKVDTLNHIIHQNCIQQMRNEIVCNHILLKLKPVNFIAYLVAG